MGVTLENPHIVLLSLAVFIGSIAALVHAIKICHRPAMTDQQWRCYMDAHNPYTAAHLKSDCPRCSTTNSKDSVDDRS